VSAGVQVVKNAAQVPAAAWDALVGPDDFYLSSRWLRVAEATAGTELNYLLSVDGPGGADGPGRLTGGLATVLAQPSSPWLLGRPDTLLEFCARDGLAGAAECLAALPGSPADTLLPSVVCGERHIGRTRALVRGGQDGGGDAAEIDGLVAAAEQLASSRGARSTVFPYVDERDTTLREVLIRRGYVSYVSGVYSWLPVPADGIAGYLRRFSAHRSRRIRADRRRLASAGVEVRIEPLTPALLRPLAELETLLLTKYGGQWSPEQSESIFTRILAELGGEAIVWAARIDGDLCGFALLLQHTNRWQAHRAGFDYAAQGSLPIYFEVMFYYLVEAAAAAGITEIHYGTGSAEAKRSHGCRTTDQYAFQRIMAMG
jgi:predicted N-acyltransferase